jgi:pyruvate kinase
MVTWESKGAPAMGRRAKIVCTLGPATSSAEQIMELVASGLDVARMNIVSSR